MRHTTTTSTTKSIKLKQKQTQQINRLKIFENLLET